MSKILKAEDIYKTYRSPSGNVEALRGISLTFEEKLCYAIIGKSGSGKSTLLHVLGCLDRPDAGRERIFMAGETRNRLFSAEDIWALCSSSSIWCRSTP